MATITPILDTLLPQVFGRLGDLERFSATRVNNPLSAITAITSDGDGARRGVELARTSIGRQQDVAAARGQSATQTAAKTAAEPAPVPAGPGAADVWSGSGHISRAGAALAALFQRFPAAPKSATTTGGPLMTGDTAPQPAALAAILAGQVGDSGVFYEAHLLQWFEGRRAHAGCRCVDVATPPPGSRIRRCQREDRGRRAVNPPADDNPSRTHAVALGYDENDFAPRVLAKGYGDIADAIIVRARKHGLHTHRSPELTRLLMRVDLDAHIPSELYQAVAELLAWVYELDNAARGKTSD